MAKGTRKKKAARQGEVPKAASAGIVSPDLPSWVSRDWFWGLLLLVAVILAYQPVWYAGFIWDDDSHVTANPCIVGPLGLKEIWTTQAASICPLVLTTFWVEHALWGLQPLPYHLVNVLMHGACAVLLWQVLRSLRVPGAWLGAALWALHPVEVESAAWVTEMKNTQSCLFFLLSILFFVRGLKKPNGWNYGLTLLFAALAMASKSSTVILPLVLGLCAWWVEGRWHWRHLVRVGPIFLMSLAAAAVTLWTQKWNETHDPQFAQNWLQRGATVGDAVWFYLGKLLWPHPLMTIYPRWQIDAGQWVSYLPLLVMIVVLFILWLKRESWSRGAFFAFAYFLVALLPVLGLVGNSFLRYSFVADHFQYLASMGPLTLIGVGLTRVSAVVLAGKRRLQATICAGLLTILGLLSWQRTWAYESQETLWTDALAKNPNSWVSLNSLGTVLFQKGHADEAIVLYQKALKLNSNDHLSHYNLGYAYFQKGQVDESIAEYQKTLEIKPNYAEAHNNLGNDFFQKGKMEEAMDQYQKALEIKPNYAEVYYNMGTILFQKKQPDQAIAEFQKALKIDPNYVDAYNNLGNVFLQKGQVDEALQQFQKAVELKPNHAKAHNNLGLALAQKGQLDEAMVQFQKAVEINPGFADAHHNLGRCLSKKGRIDEALVQFQKAVEINPNDSEVRNNLGIALAQKGQLDQAIIQFQEALRLKPDFAAAQSNLAHAKVMAAQKTTPK